MASGPCRPEAVRRVPIEEVMRIFVRKAGFLLNRIDQIANALYGSLAEGRETLAQAEMLLAIEAGTARDQVGLARTCGIDTSTTAIILDNLEMTGLVERVQDQRDRRRSLPVLTAQGRQRMPAVRAAFAALQEVMLAGLDGPGRALLVEQLGRIARDGDAVAPRWDVATSPFADAPSLLCRRALQICNAHFQACVSPLHVTLRQFSALIILHLHPGLSQVEYARVYGLDPSTCAIVLKKLASRGLLRAARSVEDRRKTLYETTQAGRDYAATIQPAADESEERMLASFAPADRAALRASLQAIVREHSPGLRYPGCLPWE
ncbi:MarR family transcriptional regulator [Sphingobium sp. SYK-6]|uniref:MarR family transcriptional regulator n=1 Tax=Sphingobium sp. (strain NBRC 103272 / SYK-6) TaxID=627192 RepID=UPI0013149E97|nr:MarR family transcriptional regulator [Sphingobium sp. SYK-6]